jgi:hypothetical protein
MEEIDIWWEGPFSHTDIIEKNIKSEDSENIQKDIGLYQVYSSHPLYGSDVLVYIGLTTDSFQTRLKNRWVIENGNDAENVKIYLGCIFSPTKTFTRKVQIDKIKKAEVLLINALKPAFNSSNIQSVKKEFREQSYQVSNFNSYRNLYPQFSSHYFWGNKFKNYEIVRTLSDIFHTNINEFDDWHGFSLKENEYISLGIDASYWNIENIPLVISVNATKIKKLDLKKYFKQFKKVGNFYYITALEDLTTETATDDIETQLNQLLEICTK